MSENNTREPQYGNTLELRDTIGLQSLGLMTNQVYHDDPRRLAFVLARYKFVSKMLSGKGRVAELGCGDAFGSRIVLQEVEVLHVYDFDPLFIEDIQSRRVERWPMEAFVHDILDAKLPQTYEAIYSLDVMEHIPAEREQTYLTHLVESLTEHGTLVIGMPSLESQDYASPVSKAGHVNCKSGKDLKKTLQAAFHNVFLFSMNDEVVHTGFAPMAHYLIAICTGKKS